MASWISSHVRHQPQQQHSAKLKNKIQLLHLFHSRLSCHDIEYVHSPIFARGVYRKILQWCRENINFFGSIPLQSIVPILQFSAPTQMNAIGLQMMMSSSYNHQQTQREAQINISSLCSTRKIQQIQQVMPATIDISISKQLLLVQICTIADIRGLCQALFRINAYSTTSTTPPTIKYIHDRVTLASQALLSL
jgi:hypothetical protein